MVERISFKKFLFVSDEDEYYFIVGDKVRVWQGDPRQSSDALELNMAMDLHSFEPVQHFSDIMEGYLQETHKQSYLDGFDCDDMRQEYEHVKGKDGLCKAYDKVEKIRAES